MFNPRDGADTVAVHQYIFASKDWWMREAVFSVHTSMWSALQDEICSWRLHSQVENWEEISTGSACFPVFLTDAVEEATS